MSGRRVCSLAELDPDGGRVTAELGATPVVVIRSGDQVYALEDRCSHADVPLSEGEFDPDACALECPRHGSLFALATGEALTLPAVRPVATFSVTIDGDDVLVDEVTQ